MEISGIKLLGGKIHHNKVNHIMAGESRFKIKKDNKTSNILDIQYNWGQKFPTETSPHAGRQEK